MKTPTLEEIKRHLKDEGWISGPQARILMKEFDTLTKRVGKLEEEVDKQNLHAVTAEAAIAAHEHPERVKLLLDILQGKDKALAGKDTK